VNRRQLVQKCIPRTVPRETDLSSKPASTEGHAAILRLVVCSCCWRQVEERPGSSHACFYEE
jgi:hypothetical protein